jgi:ribosomal protein L37E
MAEDENRKLADDRHPEEVKCQRCSQEFDWKLDRCPECGWEKTEWIESGRYGLGGSYGIENST